MRRSTAVSSRFIVAGGGGGCYSPYEASGGNAALTGNIGGEGAYLGGAGGTQIAGGVGVCDFYTGPNYYYEPVCSGDGSIFYGGDAGTSYGGGGGGGYYG